MKHCSVSHPRFGFQHSGDRDADEDMNVDLLQVPAKVAWWPSRNMGLVLFQVLQSLNHDLAVSFGMVASHYGL